MVASTQRSRSLPDQATLERYADLLVELGANVQQGQIVEVRADVARSELVRLIVASAYRRGARFVDAVYHDPFVRRARILHAQGDVDFAPDWTGRRVLQLGELRCARITLSPQHPPGLFDDLDATRVAVEPFPQLPEYRQLVDDRTTNWLGATCPSPEWAQLVHPGLEPDEGLALLWEQILHICRIDEADPIAVWEERFEQLRRASAALNERRFDALHFEGPGTDLTLGLFPTSCWAGGSTETVDGIRFVPNLPTEEIFTAPDPARADGVVRATKPFMLKTGTRVEGLVVRFEAGRAVQFDASAGAEALREYVARNESADRLGEIALVDREGRVGPLGTVFYNTLLDENAASHLALGSAYIDTVGDEDRERANRSPAHADFMIGGEDVDVTGITRDGERVPVLRGGAWQI
ncbi:MAG: aminopeptidase [Gaiellaceae bacterium]